MRFLVHSVTLSLARAGKAGSEPIVFRGKGRDAELKPGFGFRKMRMSRQSAIETRALAEGAKDPEVRRLLLKLAESYERVSI